MTLNIQKEEEEEPLRKHVSFSEHLLTSIFYILSGLKLFKTPEQKFHCL